MAPVLDAILVAMALADNFSFRYCAFFGFSCSFFVIARRSRMASRHALAPPPQSVRNLVSAVRTSARLYSGLTTSIRAFGSSSSLSFSFSQSKSKGSITGCLSSKSLAFFSFIACFFASSSFRLASSCFFAHSKSSTSDSGSRLGFDDSLSSTGAGVAMIISSEMIRTAILMKSLSSASLSSTMEPSPLESVKPTDCSTFLAEANFPRRACSFPVPMRKVLNFSSSLFRSFWSTNLRVCNAVDNCPPASDFSPAMAVFRVETKSTGFTPLLSDCTAGVGFTAVRGTCSGFGDAFPANLGFLGSGSFVGSLDSDGLEDVPPLEAASALASATVTSLA
mmetsp:Transcript_4828/g.9443  ORF Transcript_4828/g.9443 Transcript_4828/m.9443 type:complete len:336 (-) Transcript_4828:624-1631(-)